VSGKIGAGQPDAVSPVLVANSSALIVLDRNSSMMTLHILSSTNDRKEESRWTRAIPPTALLPNASVMQGGAVMALNAQGSVVLILINTSLFSYVLAFNSWSYLTTAGSSSGLRFSSCVWRGNRLLLTEHGPGASVLQMNVLELSRSDDSVNLDQSSSLILSSTWLQTESMTASPLSKYTERSWSSVALSDTHFLFLHLDGVEEVARVVHLSFEAASALKIIPSMIPSLYLSLSRFIVNNKNTYSPITLGNLSSLNLVSICRCSSSPSHPVYVRRVDSSVLLFRLSSHRHSYGDLLFNYRFTINNWS
jgi:hypothetical protein